MKRMLGTLLAAVLLAGTPALAATYIRDDAGMLSPDTVSQLDQRISNFHAQTGKEIVVETVPSVAGGDVQTAARNAFSQAQVNGVLIFVDKADRRDWIVPDNAAVQAGWWSAQTSQSIAQAMEAQFRAGDFDGGITTAVNMALNVYRSHVNSLRSEPTYQQRPATAAQQSRGGGIPVFWWIIIALVAFFMIRSIMRASMGPRYYGPPGAPGAPGAPGPGYGAGYGPGYGGYGWGGGGGFWSGLLGGLGGAWLGNEMFGGHNVGTGAWGNVDPTAGGGPAPDAGGWQSDPGQGGFDAGGGGDWGGGGFGGGDFGGGGFGGGGDAGGGW